MGWISGTVRSDTVTTVATFHRNCVAQALSREDGLRLSLHASSLCRELEKNFVLIQKRSIGGSASDLTDPGIES